MVLHWTRFLFASSGAKDADDTDQKGALMGGADGGTNEAKEDLAEENENNYADDSGGDKDPLGIPKYGLPDEPSKFIFFIVLLKFCVCIIGIWKYFTHNHMGWISFLFLTYDT